MGKDRVKCIRTDKNGRESVFFANRDLVEGELAKPKEKRAQGFKTAKIVEYLKKDDPKAEVYYTAAELNEQAERLAQEKFEKLLAEKGDTEKEKHKPGPKPKVVTE